MPKCIPPLFLGSLLGMHRPAIGQFLSPVPSNSPRSLCESQLSPVSFLFLKWRIKEGVRGRVKARYDGRGEKEREGKEDSS